MSDPVASTGSSAIAGSVRSEFDGPMGALGRSVFGTGVTVVKVQSVRDVLRYGMEMVTAVAHGGAGDYVNLTAGLLGSPSAFIACRVQGDPRVLAIGVSERGRRANIRVLMAAENDETRFAAYDALWEALERFPDWTIDLYVTIETGDAQEALRAAGLESFSGISGTSVRTTGTGYELCSAAA